MKQEIVYSTSPSRWYKNRSWISLARIAYMKQELVYATFLLDKVTFYGHALRTWNKRWCTPPRQVDDTLNQILPPLAPPFLLQSTVLNPLYRFWSWFLRHLRGLQASALKLGQHGCQQDPKNELDNSKNQSKWMKKNEKKEGKKRCNRDMVEIIHNGHRSIDSYRLSEYSGASDIIECNWMSSLNEKCIFTYTIVSLLEELVQVIDIGLTLWECTI